MCKIKGRHEKLKGIVVVSKQRWTKRRFTEEILQAFRFTGIRFKTTHSHIHCISRVLQRIHEAFQWRCFAKKYVSTQVVHIFNPCIYYQTFKWTHCKVWSKSCENDLYKSVSLKRLLQQLKSLCARSKVKSVNYFDCVPFPRFPADPFFAVYNKTKHVRTP